jgi:hypothetical protein
MRSPVEVLRTAAYDWRVRSITLATFLVGLALATGCYGPKVNNGGFAC